ncbi:MAG: ABC transporter ATP-binding protein/permease [Cyanothece sp. SIO2G6]|nr:ABC transporter ATP-binding protein/permease [Cyanothece sp. SIO2G6]
MAVSISSEQRFQFNRQLLRRFIEIAQPYFYPIGPQGTRTFLGLLGMMVIAVVAFTFVLTVGLTLAGNTLFPDFFGQVAGQLLERVNGLMQSPVPLLALGSLGACSGIVVLHRHPLKQRWRQWILLACLLFLSFAVNGMNVAISYVFRFLETALNQKEEANFWQFLWIYAAIIVLAVPIVILYRYIRLKLALYWREWLTKLFLKRYFSHRSYYELDSNAANTEIDNPDQRITEDIKSFTETTLRFLLDVLDSILTLLSFTVVLFSISKVLTLGLVVYASFGTAIAIFVGQRLIRVNYNQLRLEANFRYGMVHVRDHAESIAFYRGEQLEQQQVINRFMSALRNADLLIIWQSLIDLFQVGYNYFTRIVPYIIVAPLYFSGQTDFGTIGQAYFAFFQILGALSLITNQIEAISKFAASIVRLGTFYEKVSVPENQDTLGIELAANNHLNNNNLNNNGFTPQNGDSDFLTVYDPKKQIETHIAPTLAFDHLTLHTPNREQTLVRNLSLELASNERLLIVGPSGCGKSSLLRAIAGLWTNGQGIIQRPDIVNIFFLPQRPYMLLGTLRDQVVYPNRLVTSSDNEIYHALQEVNLGQLAERLGGLDVEADWPTILSLGEQQRLAFARVLLTKPQYVILDEATSALDIANERALYSLLLSLNIVYVSVGHRSSLLDYHQKVLDLDRGGNDYGSNRWSITSADGYTFAST